MCLSGWVSSILREAVRSQLKVGHVPWAPGLATWSFCGGRTQHWVRVSQPRKSGASFPTTEIVTESETPCENPCTVYPNVNAPCNQKRHHFMLFGNVLPLHQKSSAKNNSERQMFFPLCTLSHILFFVWEVANKAWTEWMLHDVQNRKL